MQRKPWIAVVTCLLVLGLAGCNREQSDWEKARAANTTDSYQLFVKKYPVGTFTAQAQARLQELNENSDWQKARDADTADAYQAFLKLHPEGKWSEEARIRIENFALAQPGSGVITTTNAAGAPVAAAPATTTPATAAPAVAAAPAAAAAPRTSRPQARPHPRKEAARGGGYGIQLGAFKSGEAAAMKQWHVLAVRYHSELHGLKPHVTEAKSGAGRLYRLQAGGLSAARARTVCEQLKRRRQPCMVLRMPAR